jgi:hypothetical protein
MVAAAQKQGRFVMRRLVVALSVIVTVFIGVITTAGRGATAQEATPDTSAMMAMATHPIVGAWRWTNDPGDPIPFTYAIFHADGTYQEVAGHDTAIGVWHPTGERSVDVIEVFQDIDPFSDAYEPGTVVVRTSMEVDATGDAASGTYSVDVRTLEGAPVFSARDLAGSLTRVTEAFVDSLATPVAGTAMVGTPTA